MTLLKSKNPKPKTNKFRVLFVGEETSWIEDSLSRVDTPIGLRAVSKVSEALEVARATRIDCAIIEQREENHQIALLAAALAAEKNIKNIVVLTAPEHGEYFSMLGPKSHTLFFPVNAVSLIDAVFAEDKKANSPGKLTKNVNKGLNKTLKKASKGFRTISQAKLPVFSLSRMMIPVVSFIYKNTALVLLASLFSVFVSYGMMIVFFLVSTHWGAPLTLGPGHELVTKMQTQLGELKIKRNLVAQQVSKENRETEQAQRRFDDANVLANYVANTLDREIEQRIVLQKDLTRQLRRLKALQRDVKKAAGKTGAGADLRRQFSKRLINRNVYDSRRLAILELRQRAAAILEEAEAKRRELAKNAKSIKLLESMRLQIQQPKIKRVFAASAEFVPLVNQVLSVKTTLNNANIELASHKERLALLNNNRSIIDKTISTMATTPLAKAAKAPVTVIFSPYANLKNFAAGQPLYACRFGILWCTQVGSTGKSIPGEVVSVHPFFGKNMRGSFVEAILSDKQAAEKEVLHVGRPPLFF